MSHKILDLIDGAAAAAEQATHLCDNNKIHKHLEYAIALLREAWIEESGQDAKHAEQVIDDVSYAHNLVALAFSKRA